MGALEKVSQRTCVCIRVAHGHRQQCGEGNGQVGLGGGVQWGENRGYL